MGLALDQFSAAAPDNPGGVSAITAEATGIRFDAPTGGTTGWNKTL